MRTWSGTNYMSPLSQRLTFTTQTLQVLQKSCEYPRSIGQALNPPFMIISRVPVQYLIVIIQIHWKGQGSSFPIKYISRTQEREREREARRSVVGFLFGSA